LKLTHRELVKKVAQNARLDEETVNKVFKALHFAITDAIEKEGDIVYLQNIGSFTLKRRKGKTDILTGVPRKTDDKMYIAFRPSRGLKIWKI
jgi:nucleoid DNA-binding protein